MDQEKIQKKERIENLEKFVDNHPVLTTIVMQNMLPYAWPTMNRMQKEVIAKENDTTIHNTNTNDDHYMEFFVGHLIGETMLIGQAFAYGFAAFNYNWKIATIPVLSTVASTIYESYRKRKSKNYPGTNNVKEMLLPICDI